jgi:uncharacterized protein with HEPN domain
MSERKPSVIIGDILQSIDHIESYTTNLNFEDLLPILWLPKRVFIMSK